MSLSQRVRPHSWISSVLTLGLAAALAACAGGASRQKVASSTSYPSEAPRAYEPAPASAASGPASDHASIEPRDRTPDRPGLGTAWGEAVAAPITFAPFVRAAPSPWAEVLLHYNDVAGVRAHADYLGMQPEPLEIFTGDGALSVALVDDAGRTLPGFQAGGRTLVLGEDGSATASWSGTRPPRGSRS